MPACLLACPFLPPCLALEEELSDGTDRWTIRSAIQLDSIQLDSTGQSERATPTVKTDERLPPSPVGCPGLACLVPSSPVPSGGVQIERTDGRADGSAPRLAHPSAPSPPLPCSSPSLGPCFRAQRPQRRRAVSCRLVSSRVVSSRLITHRPPPLPPLS